jgi:hypothetical protein
VPEPEPVEVANPFADSVPFPESAPLDSGYEKMEEVSLEQLLSEGRERPATMSGNVAVPIEVDEVEELAVEDAVPVAVMDEEPVPAIVSAGADDRVAALEQEVQQLKSKLKILRDDRRTALEAILRELNDLTERVRAQLEV